MGGRCVLVWVGLFVGFLCFVGLGCLLYVGCHFFVLVWFCFVLLCFEVFFL